MSPSFHQIMMIILMGDKRKKEQPFLTHEVRNDLFLQDLFFYLLLLLLEILFIFVNYPTMWTSQYFLICFVLFVQITTSATGCSSQVIKLDSLTFKCKYGGRVTGNDKIRISLSRPMYFFRPFSDYS